MSRTLDGHYLETDIVCVLNFSMFMPNFVTAVVAVVHDPMESTTTLI